jgi:hypothetical protein
MVGSEVLLAVAEVSVAFAGFSSIVAAFMRRGDDRESTQDLLRFWQMISYSLIALFFALFPFSLAYSGLAEPLIWATSSAVMAILIIVHYAVATWFIYRALRGAGSLSRVVIGILSIGTLFAIGAQALNSFGVMFHRSFTGYFIGLLWYVSASAMFFIRLLMAGFGGTRRPAT